jgi:predicted metal-binding membrane protein
VSGATLESLLRRDRAIVIAALAVVTAMAWAYVLWLADGMRMGGMDMTGFRMVPAGPGVMVSATAPWQATEFVFVFAMWAVMMVGMMTPSASPMILLYARVGRDAATRGKTMAPVAWFVAGYLLVWTVFSLAATLAHWALDRALLLTPMMASASQRVSGLVLVAVGIYQWTPLKDLCLRHCQAPWAFIQQHGGFGRSGIGALQLGVQHGAYCVGCCWVLMALLFVGGVMNVLWIAGLTLLVLGEKVIPAGRVLSRAVGVGLVGAGIWMIAAH